ncbi:ABC transporter ATP-binding protein [Metallumcola ferriviriculae]|uniref:ABC transporter ATP-binding protein n=1 Tax=Metallumcola ferriviriculae TaxID=3039180 RepID=A0AAU0UKA4_9FIRM|nr:ABC transporter ATP-binding protein [Desulfitibacteraceae bacterium MK1]
MLQVDKLTKFYGDFAAIENISFKVPEGSIFGFVGPNGAGKSTTIKILATLMEPSSGTAWLDGIDVVKNPRAVRGLLGYMPDFFGVYDDLKVTEYLDFYGASYGLAPARRRAVIPDLLELVDLSHKAESYVDNLSRGMKQRLCLARCLVHDPKILLLDEPASGLDPRARVEMRALLRELQQMGKTILISSHILPELAELCQHVGIIEKGRLVASGTVEEIMQQGHYRKVVKVRLLSREEEAAKILSQQPAVDQVVVSEGQVQAGFDGDDAALAKVLATLVNAKLPVISFGESSNNLEEIFMRVTKGEVN